MESVEIDNMHRRNFIDSKMRNTKIKLYLYITWHELQNIMKKMPTRCSNSAPSRCLLTILALRSFFNRVFIDDDGRSHWWSRWCKNSDPKRGEGRSAAFGGVSGNPKEHCREALKYWISRVLIWCWTIWSKGHLARCLPAASYNSYWVAGQSQGFEHWNEQYWGNPTHNSRSFTKTITG